jgi:large subunit ribosomal protein L29
MPLMRVEEIRGMSAEDRSKRLGEFRIELLRLITMIRAGGTVENPARIGELRKAIARILTVNHEDLLGIRKPKNAKAKSVSERKKQK